MKSKKKKKRTNLLRCVRSKLDMSDPMVVEFLSDPDDIGVGYRPSGIKRKMESCLVSKVACCDFCGTSLVKIDMWTAYCERCRVYCAPWSEHDEECEYETDDDGDDL